jgi:general secretion pathway protein K
MRRLARIFRSRRERGVALVSSLLIVALMATIAVELTEATRFSLFRSANMDRRDQAFWYARGARDFLEGVLSRANPGGRVMRPDDPWLAGPQIFPIEGGALAGSVRDLNNCFNLNSLVQTQADGVRRGDVQALARFTALLDALELPAGVIEPLKAQLVDWMDPDTRPEAGGAEDADYLRLATPLRASNQPMVEREEMLVLPVMTPELYRLLEPWTCVLPVEDQPPLNVNTLSLQQWPLLVGLFEGALNAREAEAVLFRRPSTGYEDAGMFWSDPALVPLESGPVAPTDVTLRSEWFELRAEVRLDGLGVTLTGLAELDGSGRIRRRGQRFDPQS